MRGWKSNAGLGNQMRGWGRALRGAHGSGSGLHIHVYRLLGRHQLRLADKRVEGCSRVPGG